MFLVESRETNQGTELHVFSRRDGEKSCDIVKDFKPYFYVDEAVDVPDDYRITYVEKGYKSISDEPLKKVFVNNSKELSKVRELFPRHFEGDIPFTQRYIIDRVGETETYPLKTLYLDIELNTENVFPDLKDPDQEVISCSFVDSFTEKPYVILYIPEDHENVPEETEELEVVRSEEDLLYGIIRYVQECDPDVISGWNVESFDLTYIIRRMDKLNIDYRKLSPMGWVYINDRYEDVKIKGRIVLDLMKAYMYFRRMSNQGKAESYSLEFTAQSVLGTGKIEHLESFRELWTEKPEKLAKYNIRDSTLVKDIDKELEIIDFFNSIRAKACSQLVDIYKTTALVDGLFLNIVHNKIVLPSKNKQGGESYDGAFVFEPKPGVFGNVLALDLKSMYPNIIKTFNMGYETLSKDGNITITEDIKFTSGIGLISGCLRDLQNERSFYKKQMKEATNARDKKIANFRQYAVKVLMNSQYGYLGFPGARLYKRDVAFAITYMGQKLIKHTAQLLEDKGYKVVYGDTDSVYVKSKKESLAGMILEGKRLTKEINEAYDVFAKEHGAEDSTLEIEFEKIFKSIVFVKKKSGKGGAKKRYAYIPLWEDGKKLEEKVEYKGFDTVRSDSPRISRVAQKDVLTMILNGAGREEVTKYLKDLDKKIRNREYPDEEIGIPKGISDHLENYKTSNPIVSGALYANKYLGKRYTKGSKPKFIYIKAVPKGFPKTHVIVYDEFIPEGFTPDFDKHNDRIFKMKLESIFEAADFGEFPDLHPKNKSLSEWG